MQNIPAKKREKAFRLRLERRSFREAAEETGVSVKTLSRWEKGWIDAQGRKHAGWKADLEKAWREKADADLQYGLILKDERLKAYEELARLAVNKIKEAFPLIKAKTATDVKALLSEARELMRCIAKEKGEMNPSPHTLVAVKADISISELAERYTAAQVIDIPVGRATEVQKEIPDAESEEVEEDDGDNCEGDAEPGSPDEMADET
ncbi:MAG: hypothetical protein V1918_05645 [Planctomycetota bacterium]